jgi:hypothetical protein
MKELNKKHTDMLLDMSEIHYECFQKHYPEYDITYENVLELNHKKMLDVINGCLDCDDDIIEFIFESMLKEYRNILKGDKPDNDDDNDFYY